MTATLQGRGKKKTTGDRHKPRRLIGIPTRVCAALEEFGKVKEASLSEMVKVACIFFLEHHNRWPVAGNPPQ